MLKSTLVSFAILLIVSLFESAILSNIIYFPAIPDILLLCSMYFSLLNGKTFGVCTGFVSGLMWDFLTGCPIGYNCLIRTVIGYIPGLFHKTINFNGFFIPAVFGFFGTISKVFIVWILYLFYPNVIINYDIISVSFAFELITNTLLAPLIFMLLRSVSRIFVINDGEL